MLVDLALISIAADYAGSITFMGETAGYKNTLGMYRVDANGTIMDVEIIFANASQTGGGGSLTPGESTVDLNLQSSERIGFFIVSDAFSQSTNSLLTATTGHYEFRNAAGNAANVADTSNPTLYYVDDAGAATAIRSTYGTTSFHAAAEASNNYALNGDAFDHIRWTSKVVDNRIVLKMAFEDLYGGGDQNFNDVVFTLDIGAVNTVVNAPATVSEVPASMSLADDVVSVAALEARTVDLLANDSVTGLTGVAITVIDNRAVTAGQTITLDNGEQLTLNSDGTVTIVGGTGTASTTINYVVVDDLGNVGTALLTINSSPVDGTDGDDSMVVGYVDADGTYIDGSDGVDDVIFGHGGNDKIFAGYGQDVIDGGDGNDFIRAGSGNDTLFGNQGRDVLDGQAGSDSMVGGDGDDVYWIDNPNDVVVEGENGGWDKVRSNVDHALGANVEELWLNEFPGAISGTGTSDPNKLVGNSNANILNGLAGADTIFGAAGDDTIVAGGGNDLVFGEDGNDSILGGAGNDKIYSGLGDDFVFGGAGNDQLTAQGERSTLVGGIDADRLFAGPGEDTIVFTPGDGRDTVKHFTHGIDHLEFQGLTINDLTITSRSDITRIFYGDGDVVVLRNMNGVLDASDFLFG